MPTFDEAGLKGFEASSWFGMIAPAKTLRPVITRLNAEIVKALNEPDLQGRFTALGARLAGNTPQAFDAYVKAVQALVLDPFPKLGSL